MKVALVHELLTMKGGAEQVLRVFAEMFPDAPIYTLLYDEKKLGDWFPRHRVRTSALQPATLRLRSRQACNILPRRVQFNHHRYLSHFPAAVEAWPFDFAQGDTPPYDLVISSSSAFVHGIITNGKPKHLSYVHSPARYLWDQTHDVLEKAGKGIFGPLRRAYLRHVFHRLRIWDAESAPRADKLIAASKEVERRIDLYWRQPSTVIYPPIDNFWLQNSDALPPTPYALTPYFLIVSTLASYKRIEIAIDACNRAKLPLKIVGEGSARKTLERRAGPTIEFYGYRQGEELKNLYAGAKATIVPGDEDFNLVALESMACGTPVIAYASGGPLETVIEGETGEFFRAPTAESLQSVITNFDHKKYSSEACHAQAKKFSKERFKTAIREQISLLMEEKVL